ncbi:MULTISPECIES: LysE family translocator [Vibrio]|uniref:LysE family translocator n=1 Tax=Vibrio TaxID=662 RepID=UPI003D1480A5
MYFLNVEAFLVAIVILTMTPGLDTALVIRNTSRGGFQDGAITSLGICLGLFVHATFSALGISVILTQSAELFSLVKGVGALYLIWLGISSLRALRAAKGVPIAETASQGVGTSISLREGFLSNVLNPKTAVFYLAFLPQFINPEYSPFAQSMAMASIHFLIAMLWQCSLSGMLNSAKSLLKSGRFMRWMEGTTGFVLIALGIKLLVEEPEI